MPHGIFQVTGMKENFSGFHTYGCRTWIRPPSKRTAKFKNNIVKGIFLGFVPRTKRNILLYICDTSHIGLANHVKFDEGMHDLPFNNLPLTKEILNVWNLVISFQLNQIRLKLPTNYISMRIHLPKWKQRFGKCSLRVLVQILVFKLNVILNTTMPTSLMLIAAKSSAAKLFSSLKASCKAIRLSFIVEIAGHCIFTKLKGRTALSKLRDEGVYQFHITLVIEPALNARQRRHNTNEPALFDPRTK